MTVKQHNHDELAKMRKGAPARTKLSVSRPAKRSIKPTTYMGTGNTYGYVRSIIGTKPSRELMQRVNNAIDYTGSTPDATTILGWNS